MRDQIVGSERIIPVRAEPVKWYPAVHCERLVRISGEFGCEPARRTPPRQWPGRPLRDLVDVIHHRLGAGRPNSNHHAHSRSPCMTLITACRDEIEAARLIGVEKAWDLTAGEGHAIVSAPR